MMIVTYISRMVVQVADTADVSDCISANRTYH